MLTISRLTVMVVVAAATVALTAASYPIDQATYTPYASDQTSAAAIDQFNIAIGRASTTTDGYYAWCNLHGCPQFNAAAEAWCAAGGDSACRNQCAGLAGGSHPGAGINGVCTRYGTPTTPTAQPTHQPTGQPTGLPTPQPDDELDLPFTFGDHPSYCVTSADAGLWDEPRYSEVGEMGMSAAECVTAAAAQGYSFANFWGEDGRCRGLYECPFEYDCTEKTDCLAYETAGAGVRTFTVRHEMGHEGQAAEAAASAVLQRFIGWYESVVTTLAHFTPGELATLRRLAAEDAAKSGDGGRQRRGLIRGRAALH